MTKEKSSPPDYVSKMGKGLLVIAVVCLAIFSTTQWVVKPYLVSRGIFNVGYLAKQGKNEKAFNQLKGIINEPTFLKDDIVIGIKKMYSFYGLNLNEEYREKMINVLIIQAREAIQERPWRFNLAMAVADLETIFSQWNENGLEQAEKSAQEILSRFPHFPNSHLFAAKFFLLNGEAEKAIVEAEKVIEINPKLSTSYYVLGLAYNQSGDSEKRDENLIKAAELNFPFKDKNQVLSIISFLIKEKDYKLIVRLYLQAIQIDPKDVSLYTGLAAAYAKIHDKEKAIEYANKVLEINPEAKETVEAFIKLVQDEQWDQITD